MDTILGTEEHVAVRHAAVIVVLVEQLTASETRVVGCVPGEERQITWTHIRNTTAYTLYVYLYVPPIYTFTQEVEDTERSGERHFSR